MKKIILFLVFTVIASLILPSCQKSYNAGNAAIKPANQSYADLHYMPQSLTVNAGRDTVVFGAKGTMLHFYPYSFKNATNEIISSGTIDLQLTEMYKPGDMISNNAPSRTTDGYLLQSGGEINITATMDGRPVTANKYGVGFKQSAPLSVPMNLYYGNSNNTKNVLKWSISDTTTPGTIAFGTKDTVMSGGHLFDSSSIPTWTPYVMPNLYIYDTTTKYGLVNCDRLYRIPNSYVSTTVSVTLPNNNYTPDNTQIYMVLTSLNSVVQIEDDYDVTTNTISLNDDGTTVPIGMSYELAVISNYNGNYYYYQTSGTTTANFKITAELAPITLQDIKDHLAGL